jgi:hypothetical protein
VLTVAFALECQQEEAARRATADRWRRVAPELRDGVIRCLDEIATGVGAAVQLIDTDPAEAKRALAGISLLSRSATAEIRQLSGMVRDDEPTDA